MPTVTFTLSIGMVGKQEKEFDTSKDFGIPDAAWEVATHDERDAMLEEPLSEWANNLIDYGWTDE